MAKSRLIGNDGAIYLQPIVNLGDEVIVNPSFTSDTVWDKDSDWTINVGEQAVATAVNTDTSISQTSVLVVDTWYRVIIDVDSLGAGTWEVEGFTGIAVQNSSGIKTFTAKATGTTFGILAKTTTTTMAVNDVSVKEMLSFEGDNSDTLDELAGGAAASEAGKGFYQVTSVAATGTNFTWTSPEVGDYFYNDGTLVPDTDDNCRPVILLTDVDEDASIKSFEISLSKDKVDVTALSDDQKSYRMGKTDASGTLTAITVVSNDTIKNRFMDIMDVSSVGAFTMTRLTNDELYFVGYLNDEETSGDTMAAVIGKIEIESGSLGAADGSAQEFSASFAPASDDRLQLINIDIA